MPRYEATRDNIYFVRHERSEIRVGVEMAPTPTETSSTMFKRVSAAPPEGYTLSSWVNGGLFHTYANDTADSPYGTTINDTIDEGVLISDRGFVNLGLCVRWNGDFYFDGIEPGALKDFIGGSPALLQFGKVSTDQQGIDNAFMTASSIRTFIGSDDTYFYMGVTLQGMPISKLRTILYSWGLKDAINLDGGGSSHLGINDNGTARVKFVTGENRAVDNHVCVFVQKEVTKPMGKTIFLDPGHGGSDPGAVSGVRKEAVDNLRLGLAVRDILVANGFSVIMSRTTDANVSLAERTTAANVANADLYVSLHRNSFSSSSANGVEIWVYTGDPRGAKPFANKVLERIVASGVQSNRGIKEGNYFVLRETKMPAMLIELGFISNATDNNLFDTKNYAQAVAQGIIDGMGIPAAPAEPTDIVTELTAEIDKLKTQLAAAQDEIAAKTTQNSLLVNAMNDIRERIKLVV